MESYPHPDVQFKDFYKAIVRANKSTDLVWNPLKKRMEPWINPDKIARQFHKGVCTIS